MNYSKYQRLRQLVLLGMEEHNWVNEKTLTGHAKDFLNYVFPRTSEKATFQLAKEIATQEHDKNIQGNMTHLFRFPQSDEQELSKESLSENNFNVVAMLEELAEGVATEISPGPVNIGSISELDDKILLNSFAHHYAEAFKNNYKTYPYLT